MERIVRTVRQLEQHGVQGDAGKQKDCHRNVSAKKRHSRNNKTFLVGLNYPLLAQWRGEAWKLNPEKVRNNNMGFSRRAVRLSARNGKKISNFIELSTLAFFGVSLVSYHTDYRHTHRRRQASNSDGCSVPKYTASLPYRPCSAPVNP